MQSYYPSSITLKWLKHPSIPGMDTEALYVKNRASRSSELREQGWWEYEPFDYCFNSQGFRSDEFDTNTPGIMYLGCSFTLGEALPAELTWPRLVSRSMNQPCWNLGQSGGALDTCFRLAEHWIPQLKPKMVILLTPPGERVEIIDGDGIPRLYSAHGFSPGAREWLAHAENGRLSDLKNIGAIRDLCRGQEIPCHVFPFYLFYSKEWQKSPVKDLARDLMHPGARTHHQFAERVLREINAHGVD